MLYQIVRALRHIFIKKGYPCREEKARTLYGHLVLHPRLQEWNLPVRMGSIHSCAERSESSGTPW